MKANPYVWNFGDMKARNLTTGDNLNIHMKKKGWVSKKDFSVSGEITNANKTVMYVHVFF